MKSLLLSFCLLFCTAAAHAQWEWMDSGTIPSQVSHIVPTSDGKYVMVEGGDKGKVVFLNAAGQVEATVNLGDLIDVVEFITFAHPLPDSGLLTVVNFVCASIQSRVISIQANGQISTVEVPYWSSDGLHTAAYPLPDDTFVLYDPEGFGNTAFGLLPSSQPCKSAGRLANTNTSTGKSISVTCRSRRVKAS